MSVCLHIWRGQEFCGRLALSAGIFKATQTDRLTGRQTSRHVLFPVAFDVDLALCFFSLFPFYLLSLFIYFIVFGSILEHNIM